MRYVGLKAQFSEHSNTHSCSQRLNKSVCTHVSVTLPADLSVGKENRNDDDGLQSSGKFESEIDELIGRQGKLHSEQLHNVYSIFTTAGILWHESKKKAVGLQRGTHRRNKTYTLIFF
jgi:hypothetical protein